MTARCVLVVLLGDDHVLMCYVNVCMMIVLHDEWYLISHPRTCICVQMNENKIIFILNLCMNVFDVCMHGMMMVSICKEEYSQCMSFGALVMQMSMLGDRGESWALVF